MQLTGQVTFRTGTVCNQVTLEGASVVTDSLTNNSMGYITNILFITDADALAALMTAVGNEAMQVTWQLLQTANNGVVYNPLVYAAVVEAAPEGELAGGILINELNDQPGQRTIRCSCYFDAGTVPVAFENTSILAMALIVNGSLQPFTAGAYVATGNERVLCFVPLSSNIVLSAATDNNFIWDFNVSVLEN